MRSWLKRGADAVGAVLFAALFLTFIVQITARFGFNRPLPWTDELAVILWAAAFMVPAKEHVMFDLVYNMAGRSTRRGMLLLGSVLVGGLAAYAIPGSWDYVRFMAREGTPVLGLPFMWVFIPFVFLLLALVVRSAVHVVALLRHRSRELD